jgi:phospholipid/cholesterol/gamma-HCH transport system substrate-binding protein
MKKHTSNKIRLGVFVSLGIALFIAGIYFIGERQQLFRSTFRLSGVFKDVGGLQAGNNVRFSGINVGTVENISVVSDSSVRVNILIDESTRRFIKKDAIASIGSEGLMGNKTLIITPGTGGKKEIENNDTVATAVPLSIDDILVSLKTTIDNTSNITSNLSKITTTIQSGEGTIGRLLMDQSLAQNFDSSIVNLKQGSEGFKNLVDDVTGGFQQINIKDILISLKTTMDNTSNITGDLSRITNTMQSGKGALGGMLMDSSMRQNFDSTFINLKVSSAEMKILLDKAKHSWLLWGF